MIQLYNYCDVSLSIPITTTTYNRTQRFWLGDKWPIKTLITFIMVLDTIHEVILVKPVYTYLIVDFGNLEKLAINDP